MVLWVRHPWQAVTDRFCLLWHLLNSLAAGGWLALQIQDGFFLHPGALVVWLRGWAPSRHSSETLLVYLHYSRWTSYLMAQCPRDVPTPQEADAISLLSLFWETDIACSTIFFESRPSGFNRKRCRPTS